MQKREGEGLKMKSKNLFFIIFICFYLCLFFLLGEFVIRIFKPEYTFYGRFHIISDFWPRGLFSDSDILPCKLNPGRYHVQHKKNNVDMWININSLGYRGKPFSLQNRENNIRILFIGSSVTFGFGIEDNQTMPALLEETLKKKLNPKIEVINAGFQGYTSLSHYVYLRNFGVNLHPQIVILEVSIDGDLTDLFNHRIKSKDARGRPTKVYDKYKVVDGFRVHRDYNKWLFKIPMLKHSQFYYFLMARVIAPLYDRICYAKDTNKKILNINDLVDEWYKYINYIRELCDDNSIKLIVVTSGTQVFLEGKFSEEHKKMTSKLRENNIEFIDVALYLSDLNLKHGELWFPYDGHPSPFALKKSVEFMAGHIINSIGQEYKNK